MFRPQMISKSVEDMRKMVYNSLTSSEDEFSLISLSVIRFICSGQGSESQPMLQNYWDLETSLVEKCNCMQFVQEQIACSYIF